MFEVLATALGLVLASIPIAGSWIAWRRQELRREDVHNWAKDAVRSMQSVVVLCADWGPQVDEEYRKRELTRLAIDLSCLLEQGRLFFQNEKTGWGAEKEPTYQGLRPRILDQLLVGYCVASGWERFGAKKGHAARVAENAEKAFLSLAQQEVGRKKTASAYNREGGESVDIKLLIEEEQARFEKIAQQQARIAPGGLQ